MSEIYQSPKIAAAEQDARLAGPDLAALAREVLARGGAFSFRATGSSMSPTIRSGETVLVRSREFDRLRPGDVVMACLKGGLVIVHRVIGRTMFENKPTLITMGDNSSSPDLPLTDDEIIGLVTAVWGRGRKTDLEWRFYKIGGRLLARLQARGITASGAAGARQRRLLAAGGLLLKRVLRLGMRL